jgi:transposase-like protein
MSKRIRRYSQAKIEEIVFRVQSGELSVHSARQEYAIGGKMTVYRWLQRYSSKMCQKQASTHMPKKQKLLQEANRNIELEATQLRLEYYETIFALAKEEYGVDFKEILGPRSDAFIKDAKDSNIVPDSE